jgi:hypothetical protein
VFKSLVLSVLCFSFNANALVLGIDSHFIKSSEGVGEFELIHSEGDFYIYNEGKVRLVEKYNVDECLRPLKTQQLALAMKCCYLTVVKLSDGEFVVRAHVKGAGGGAVGAAAGVVIGKAATYVVCYGSIAAVSAGVALINPWAGKATWAALTKFFALTIETASNKVAIGTGIALGTATGPV